MKRVYILAFLAFFLLLINFVSAITDEEIAQMDREIAELEANSSANSASNNNVDTTNNADTSNNVEDEIIILEEEVLDEDVDSNNESFFKELKGLVNDNKILVYSIIGVAATAAIIIYLFIRAIHHHMNK